MELANRMGFRIIKGKGDFNGGDCRVHEDKVIVINKVRPIEYQSKNNCRRIGESWFVKSLFDSGSTYIYRGKLKHQNIITNT